MEWNGKLTFQRKNSCWIYSEGELDHALQPGNLLSLQVGGTWLTCRVEMGRNLYLVFGDVCFYLIPGQEYPASLF